MNDCNNDRLEARIWWLVNDYCMSIKYLAYPQAHSLEKVTDTMQIYDIWLTVWYSKLGFTMDWWMCCFFVVFSFCFLSESHLKFLCCHFSEWRWVKCRDYCWNLGEPIIIMVCWTESWSTLLPQVGSEIDSFQIKAIECFSSYRFSMAISLWSGAGATTKWSLLLLLLKSFSSLQC